ncbi:hypothetical protein IMSAG025_01653 [Muribaculaceae bacterium]|nr:hypothetical protein IMSAG025_01653 [Muribaculaceae bacterium]
MVRIKQTPRSTRTIICIDFVDGIYYHIPSATMEVTNIA